MKEKSKRKSSKTLKTIENIYKLFILRSIIFDILIIALGLFFVINPFSGLRGEIIFSIILLVSGVMSFYDWPSKKLINLFNFSLIYGILSVLLGMLIIINPLALSNVITLALGIWVFISGLFKTINAFNLKNNKEETWSITVGIGVFMAIIGLLVIFNPFVELYIIQMAAIFIVLYAVLDLTNNILFKKRTKEILKIFK